MFQIKSLGDSLLWTLKNTEVAQVLYFSALKVMYFLGLKIG
jgi:hypothetical protein